MFNNFGNQQINNNEYYNLLGVEKTATKNEIRKAYHKLAIKCHPDKGGDPEKFKHIAEAFEVLSDPDKKKTYDTGGKEALKGDISQNPMNMFSQMFSGHTNHIKKGGNTEYTMNITLEDVYNGKNKNISLTRNEIDKNSITNCLHCNGQGVRIQKIQMGPMIQQIQTPCNACNGVGKKYKSKKIKENIKIYIPKGVSQDKRIVIDGKGEDIADGEPGDLIVSINIIEHDIFKRKGNDLFIDKKITLLDSISGVEMIVKQIDGRSINIKSNVIINPTLHNTCSNKIEWSIFNKDCNLEPFANANIQDVDKIKQIITEGQLKDKNINAFIIKNNSTFFYTQPIDEIKKNLITKSNSSLYIKQQDIITLSCIEEEGLPFEENNILRGDLYINFIIEFPDKLVSNELKTILIKNNFTSKNDILDDENEEFNIIQKNPSISFNEYKSKLDNDDNLENGSGPQPQCAQQ